MTGEAKSGDGAAPVRSTPGGHEILRRLLDATPLPTPGSEVEPLLDAFERILSERDAILALIVPPLRVAEADRVLLRELEERQTAWDEALAAARAEIGGQRCGAGRLRAYADALTPPSGEPTNRR